MAFNYPSDNSTNEILIPPYVQYAISVDGINTKVMPVGTNPNVVYRIGDGTVHSEGWDNVDGNKYLDFYIAQTTDDDIVSIADDIEAVGLISDEVVTVAGIASDVATVADNVVDITNFSDVYLGGSATEPTTRNNGDALVEGDLYFDTVDNEMNVYDGASWQVAYITTAGVLVDSDIGVTVQGYDANTAKYDDATPNFTGDLQKSGSSVLSISDTSGSIGNLTTPLLDLPLQSNLAMKQGVGSVFFERSTTATYIDRYGVLQYAEIDEARFEKDGLLVEGASTNIVTYSGSLQYNANDWLRTNGAQVETSYTELAPDGSTTATKVTVGGADTGAGYNQILTSTPTANSTVTLSAWFKKDSTTVYSRLLIRDNATSANASYVNFNHATGEIYTPANLGTYSNASSSIVEETSDWYRISLTTTIGADTAIRAYTYSTSSVAGDFITIWGAQLEELPFATSYIPTTTTAVTRGKDICDIDRSNNMPLISEATIYMEWVAYGDSANQYGVLHISHDSTANRIRLFTNSLTLRFGTTSASSSTGNLEYDFSSRIGEKLKIAIILNGANRYMYIDGVLVSSDSGNGTEPLWTVDSYMSFLSQGISNQVGTHGSNLKIYDKALTATEVALLGGN